MKTKKILIALITAIMMLAFTAAAYAAPQILFTTNGAAKQYSTGAVLLVRGWVGENKVGSSDIPVLVVVQNSSNTIYSSLVNTDANGFFTTNFNLGSGDKVGDTIKVSVHAANTSKEDSFTVKADPMDFQFLGGSIPLVSDKTKITPQPVPGEIALVFTSNVNYYNNTSWPATSGLPSGVDSNLGPNERNADCIHLYNDATGEMINSQIILSDSEDVYGLYYPVNSIFPTDSKGGEKGGVVTNKNMLRLTPWDDLLKGKLYRIVIDSDLTANNSASLGKTQTVYFKTESSGSNGGGDVQNQPPATPAKDLGTIKTDGQNKTVVVDTQKALDIVNDPSQTALSIDLSALGSGPDQQTSVQLSPEIVAAAQAQNKPIVLQNGGFAIVIPAAALASNQAVTITTQQVNAAAVPASPAGVSNPTVYEFNAGQSGQSGYQFQQQVTITLPIPAGVANPELLSVYCLNESTRQWEYVGGRIVDGKLVFQTSHFSKYMLAESTRTFKDIVNHWAKSTIEIMVARQVVSGVSADEFAPERNITRAEFATLLTKAMHLDPGGANSGFSDVAPTDWYAAYVSKAAGIGIISGYAGQFRPQDQINRQEMSAMIMRAYSYKHGKSGNSAELTFVDKDAISPWAVEAVQGAYNIGVIKGRGEGRFAPLENATRAEAAMMLKSFMDKLGL